MVSKKAVALVGCALICLSAGRAAGYVLFTGYAWADNPFIIRVQTDTFINLFSFDADRSLGFSKAAEQSWLNLGIDVPRDIRFRPQTYTATNSVDVSAQTCCDGDCTSGCLGLCTRWSNSDDCKIEVWKRTQVSEAALYSDDRSKTYDVQGILTHEFGHCHGLDHPPSSSPEAIMLQGYYFDQKYPKRFPRADDRAGALYTEGRAAWPLYYRLSWGTWQSTGETTNGSPGIAHANISDGYPWQLLAWQGAGDPAYINWITYRAGVPAPKCTITTEYTYDGVSAAQDGDGFAIAFRANDDSSHVRVFRHIFPVTVNSCGTNWVFQPLTDTKTRRRPSIAWDAATQRLVLVYIDADDGTLRVRTSNPSTPNTTSPSWSTPVTITGEYTDTPVGIDCGYQDADAASRCYLFFPTADGKHSMRMCKGYISSGNYVNLGCSSTDIVSYSPGNTGPAVRLDSASVLKVLYTATNDARDLYTLTRTCSGTSCSWSNAANSGGGQSPVAPAIAHVGYEAHAGY